MRHDPPSASWALYHTKQRAEHALDITVRATGSPATPWWLSGWKNKASWGFQILGDKNCYNQNAPREQNLPVKNTVDTSTLIYPPVVDPCRRSPTNTASIKALFIAWVRKIKTAVPEDTRGASTASPNCKFPTNPTRNFSTFTTQAQRNKWSNWVSYVQMGFWSHMWTKTRIGKFSFPSQAHRTTLLSQLVKLMLFKLNHNLHLCSALLIRQSTKWLDHHQQSIFQQFLCDEKNHLHSFSCFSFLHQRLWYTTYFHTHCDRMRPHAQTQSRRAESHFNFPLICFLKSVIFCPKSCHLYRACCAKASIILPKYEKSGSSHGVTLMSDHHSSHVSRNLTSPNKKDSSVLQFWKCVHVSNWIIYMSLYLWWSIFLWSICKIYENTTHGAVYLLSQRGLIQSIEIP